ncbi:Hypothetical predicted protein [Scomber scombrus]|uniref:Secreted protein n=1 Tax=Scomber scombrus TaxID=13677 RepID=A0AAV1MQZ4_SCOSC
MGRLDHDLLVCVYVCVCVFGCEGSAALTDQPTRKRGSVQGLLASTVWMALCLKRSEHQAHLLRDRRADKQMSPQAEGHRSLKAIYQRLSRPLIPPKSNISM